MAEIQVEEIIVNVSDVQKSWRLVHDGTKVTSLFESSGETLTRLTMFCATTEQECLDEIERLGLEYVVDNSEGMM